MLLPATRQVSACQVQACYTSSDLACGEASTPGSVLIPHQVEPLQDGTLPRPQSAPLFCLAAAILSGVLMFACFAPVGWTPLVWVACTPLVLAAVSEPRLRRAYLWGALAGATFLAGSLYWFIYVMEVYGHLRLPIAVAVMILFLAVMSAFFGAFSAGTAWIARRSLRGALVFAAFFWVGLELLRTYFPFGGFPWNLLGYAVGPNGLRQLASFTGVYGLSFIAVASSALVAGLILWPSRPVAWALALAWSAVLAGANARLRPAPLPAGNEPVVLVQPNVPLDDDAVEAWAPWRDPQPLANLVSLSEAGAAEVARPDRNPWIIWAENPAPFYFFHGDQFAAAMRNLAQKARAYLLFNTNIFPGSAELQPTNSALLLDPGGEVVLRYDKIHLVPFGEYVPDWLPRWVGKITSQVGNYVPGKHYVTAQTPRGSVGVSICYEDTFPQLVRRLTPAGPGVLVNISDDAWYGNSAAALQHLQIAQLRAVENHRYLLRATNDGITALIDPYGRLVNTLPRHRMMVLTGHFSFRADRTFYSAHGDVFAWTCVGIAALMAAVAVAGRRRPAVQGDSRGG
jgi:apolipoprotein N-acyltransferase